MTIWNCYGYDTKKEMHDILSYMIETADKAYARCKEQNPNFEIYTVTLRAEPVPCYTMRPQRFCPE